MTTWHWVFVLLVLLCTSGITLLLWAQYKYIDDPRWVGVLNSVIMIATIAIFAWWVFNIPASR